MKQFINNMKYINDLWSWLGFYVWGGTWIRANHTCDLIDDFEKEHPFCGWLARWKNELMTIVICGIVFAGMYGLTIWLG